MSGAHLEGAQCRELEIDVDVVTENLPSFMNASAGNIQYTVVHSECVNTQLQQSNFMNIHDMKH